MQAVKIKDILKPKEVFIKHDQFSKPLSKPKELVKARNKNRSCLFGRIC